MSLKIKTITSLFWSFTDSFANYGIQFIFGIILARLLSPREYGLIGMIALFLAISQSFIDSGFQQALIRRQNCSQRDYSTIFFFNVFAGLLLYFVLFFFAHQIQQYFKEPQLFWVTRILGLSLIIQSLSIIQITLFTKSINFKLQTRISIIASILSGIIGITFAFYDYGVWSLVIKILSKALVELILLWKFGEWRPTLEFDLSAFRQMYAFGSKLMASGLLYVFSKNIYYVIIGKYFSSSDLGFYTRAEQFCNLPSSTLSSVILRVSYPICSTIQDDKNKLKSAYKQLISSSMLISFLVMIGLLAVSKPLILALLGPKWANSIILLRLLCIANLFYPMHVLNLNILTIKGRSDLFLKLEVIKSILIAFILVIGIYYGIIALLISMIVVNTFGIFINSWWSLYLIGYSVFEQLKDIFPSFLLSSFVGLAIYSLGEIVSAKASYILLIQFVFGLVFLFSLMEVFKLKYYIYIKRLAAEKLLK